MLKNIICEPVSFCVRKDAPVDGNAVIPALFTDSDDGTGQTPVRGSHTLAAGQTPMLANHTIAVRTPSGKFIPSDISTPVAGATAASAEPVTNKCPLTPVEIRKFLGTNNSGTGR